MSKVTAWLIVAAFGAALITLGAFLIGGWQGVGGALVLLGIVTLIVAAIMVTS